MITHIHSLTSELRPCRAKEHGPARHPRVGTPHLGRQRGRTRWSVAQVDSRRAIVTQERTDVRLRLIRPNPEDALRNEWLWQIENLMVKQDVHAIKHSI